MSGKGLGRRLERLEEPGPPTREEYDRAFGRARLRVIRVLGAGLTGEELDLLKDRNEEADADTLRRYRASLPEKKAERERVALLSGAYGEAELRGVDPWGSDDFGELADVLEARGWDASGVRYFSD